MNDVPITDELLEVPVPKSEGDEGWEETWFDDAEQSAATPKTSGDEEPATVAISTEELPTIMFDDVEDAAVEAAPHEAAFGGLAESEPAASEATTSASTPGAESDESDGDFNWKLD